MPDDDERESTNADDGDEPRDVPAKERLENVGDEIQEAADEAEQAGDDVKKEVRDKLDDAGPS